MTSAAEHQVKSLTAVGTPMIIVAAEKYRRASSDMPATNMWCAHT